MNGFHIRKKVMADHKSWPSSCNLYEVSESVKMSVNGKIELKMRKRLIFSRSFRNLRTRITKGAGSRCLLMLLLSVEVFLLLLAAGGQWNGNFLIRADCSLHYPMWRLNDAPYLVISPYLDILKAMIH